MNRYILRIIAFMVGLASGAAFAADPEPAEAEPVPDETVLGAARPMGEAPVFYMDMRDAMAGLATTQGAPRMPNDASRSVHHLQLAERYLNKGLILEALSFAEGIPAGALSPELAQKRDYLAAVARVLDPRPGSVPQVAEGAFSAMPQQEVFEALAHARAGRVTQAAAGMVSHVDDLTELPVPLQVRALPYLLQATIEANDWATSRALVLAFQDHPALADSAAFSFLLGQTALQYGERLRAFDHFAIASGSADKWGHRARLRMVDLAVANGGVTAEEHQHMLMRIYGAWRRGPEASGTLLRIEELQTARGDRLGALETLSTLMTNHAGSPEAQAGQERARSILAEYYREFLRDGADLNTVIENHGRVAKDYRFFQGFDAFAEKFGDHLLSLGITGRAAQEYRLTGEYLAAASGLDLFDTPKERFDALRLKEAEALLAGGQLERAKGLLEQPLDVDAPRAAARLASLRAEYFARTGEALSETDDALQATPSGYIRELAEQYFEAEDWERARLEYLKLARVLGDDLPTTDAANLFLAAERSGDMALSKVLGELLAQRQDFDPSSLMAEVGSGPAIGPEIRRKALEAVVERTGRMLTDVGALVEERPAGSDE